MTNTPWTPGPWEARRGQRMKRWDVGTVIVSYVARQIDSEADARIIAAAPEMAELLRAVAGDSFHTRDCGFGATHDPMVGPCACLSFAAGALLSRIQGEQVEK